MKFSQEMFLKPGTYGRLNKRTFSKEELTALCENTNAMIKSGVAVPVFDEHPTLGTKQSGPQRDSRHKSRKAIDAVGWVQSISANENGELSWDIDIQDSKYSHALKQKTIRRTSPEIGSFREYWPEGSGKNWGQVIRHAAFTAFPKNAHQTDLIALSEDKEGDECIQVSLECLQMSEDSMHEQSENVIKNTNTDNPNMPEDSERKAKKMALVAQLQEAGIVLPNDFDLDGEHAIDILLGVVMTYNKARQEAESSKRQSETSVDVVAEPQHTTQLSEEDEMVNTKLMAYATKLQRENIANKITQAKIPDGIRKTLQDRLETVQFSEDESQEDMGFIEEPTFTMSDVLEMVASSMPEQVINAGLVTSESENESVTIPEPEGQAASEQSEMTPLQELENASPEEVTARVKAMLRTG